MYAKNFSFILSIYTLIYLNFFSYFSFTSSSSCSCDASVRASEWLQCAGAAKEVNVPVLITASKCTQKCSEVTN